MQPTIPCIVYHSKKGIKRAMIVINTQPFYQSTGRNSEFAGSWLPFIMLRGTIPLKLDNFPKKLQISTSKKASSYIIKYTSSFFPTDLAAHVLKGRIPTKQTLIAASQINITYFSTVDLILAGLSKEEIKKAQTPIVIQTKNRTEFTDPDDINKWLCEQGASYIADIINIPSKTEITFSELSLFPKISDKAEEEVKTVQKSP